MIEIEVFWVYGTGSVKRGGFLFPYPEKQWQLYESGTRLARFNKKDIDHMVKSDKIFMEQIYDTIK